MKRFLLLTALSCVLAVPMLTAQAQAPANAPANTAKYIPPVKGLATIEVIQSSRRVGKEWVTTVKVRNTSKGSINLLKAEEYWYDANVKIVSANHSSTHPIGLADGRFARWCTTCPTVM